MERSLRGEGRYRFGESKVAYVYGFFGDILRLPTPDGSVPFRLLPWQKFVVKTTEAIICSGSAYGSRN